MTVVCVVFMLLSLYAPDVLADVPQDVKEEIFVVDMERTSVA